jgi:hypothetical protein
MGRLERAGAPKTRTVLDQKAAISARLLDVENKLSRLRMHLKRTTKT